MGNAFKGYNVYRRATRAVAGEWERIAEIRVPTGRAPSTVEAQHIKIDDYEAGWAGATASKFSDGWDYAVTSLNATTGLEQTISAGSTANTVTSDAHMWAVCNKRPWNSFPLERAHRSFVDDSGLASSPARIAGRDQVTTRTRLELPGRNQSIDADFFSVDGEDPLRYWRAAAASGERFCLHLPLGDRILGTFDELEGDENTDSLYLAVRGKLIETSRKSAVTDYNLPCGVVLNGSTQYVSAPDADGLDPASSAFSVVACAVWGDAGSSQYGLTKGNVGSAAGYGFHSNGTANTLAATITGASTSAVLTEASATWFDGLPHAAVVTSSGTAQVLYRDGTSVDSDSVTHGAVSNAVALVMGGNNGGATDGMSMVGHSFAVYMRALTATEAKAASYYLLGYPGYRMPYGAAVFVDLRDDRCWNGTGTVVRDLSGNRNHGTLTASPSTRGYPWTLSDLERFG